MQPLSIFGVDPLDEMVLERDRERRARRALVGGVPDGAGAAFARQAASETPALLHSAEADLTTTTGTKAQDYHALTGKT
jgi:hypothetical protein